MKTITKLITVLAVLALSVAQREVAFSENKDHKDQSAEVTGDMTSNQIVYQEGVPTTIYWSISRPLGNTNNGHGNNVDGVDSSNPGVGGGGPNGVIDESTAIDDEIKGGDPSVNSKLAPNMLRQLDLDTGIVMDIYSNLDVGSILAGMPITGSGAIFELWADVNGVMTLLDIRGIGPYMPTATFLVTSQDPWQRTVMDPVSGTLVARDIFRTRADIAFSVQATAGGLSTDPLLPMAARAVSLEIYGQNGDPVTYELGAEYALSDVSLAAAAPSYTWTGLSQLTPFSDPEKEIGQQHFSMWTYADGTMPSWQVGRATVIIWPMASGTFNQVRDNASGQIDSFDSDQTFDGEVRDILVNYVDLYPESNTYVQMYKGPQVTGAVGMPITVTSLDLAGLGYDVPQNSQPQGIKIRNVDLEEVINIGGNGLYTLEIITGNLPWINGGAYESVAYINFTVTRSVNIRVQIGTK